MQELHDKQELLPAPPKKRHFFGNAGKSALERLRYVRSQGQGNKAFQNLVRFFVVMLVLTLVVRGTAGASLPRVQTGKPSSGEIKQKIAGTALVKSGGQRDVLLPEDLTIDEVLVKTGQKVAEGDVLCLLDMEKLQQKADRYRAQLEELKAREKSLSRTENADTFGVDSARREYERAGQDQTAYAQGNQATVASARAGLEQAQTRYQGAKEAFEALDASTVSPEEWEAARQDMEQAAQAVTEQQQALQTAEQAASQDAVQRQRAVEDARAALEKQERDLAQNQQQQADTSTKNQAEKQEVWLDIQEKQEALEELQQLLDSQGRIAAPLAGTVKKAPRQNSKTDASPVFELSDESKGFEAEMSIPQKQAQKIQVEDSCDVSLPSSNAYFQDVKQGVVRSLSAPDESDMVQVGIELPPGNWKEGQSLDVEVVQSRDSYPLCVPVAALHSDNQGYYVLTVEQTSTVLGTEMVAKQVPVTIKARNNELAAVEGILSEQDRVIVSSSKMVAAGDKVRLKES